MFHMGGQYWNAWNQRLHPLLVGSQIRDGEMAGQLGSAAAGAR